MKIYWLNPTHGNRSMLVDLAYMNFNTACKEHDWIKPIIDWEKYHTAEQVVDEILSHDIDVLCFSTYVWSHWLCHVVVEQIKEKRPDIITIMGGPHQGYNDKFFDKYPHVDYACYATGHGELFLKAILPQLSEHRKVVDAESIPYLISRNYVDNPKKLVYEWEESSLENNLEYITEVVLTARQNNKSVMFDYETTRGCPYACTFCEWGGGTSSKISKKPIDMIMKEIEIISFAGIDDLGIIDANFGILERDAEILTAIGELKNQNNYPKDIYLYGLAKTKVEKKKKVLDVLFKYKMTDQYSLPIQAYDVEVLKNVKRPDIPFDENIALAKYIADTYNVSSRIELILGLPGYTLETFYKEMDLLNIGEYFSIRNIFSLLPDSEASSSFYRTLYKIKTAYMGSMDNEENPDKHITDNVLSKYRSPSEVVISAKGFTESDWKEMFYMNRASTVLREFVPADMSLEQGLRDLFNRIKETTWYKEIDSHLDKAIAGELWNKDVTVLNDKLLEEITRENVYSFESMVD